MAKVSQAGTVKTRLVPPLALEQAATLNTCFIRDLAANIQAASASADVAGYIAYTPRGAEPFFRDILPDCFGLLEPREAGLGPSLFCAAEDLLTVGHGAACLVNGDSPTLPTRVLVEAAEALAAAGDRVVLGPSDDGGYYLIGLKHPHRSLFEGIDWSTDRVFRQTVERTACLGLETIILPKWYDVDDAASLRILCGELLLGRPFGKAASRPFAAPHTADYLCRLEAAGAIVPLGLTRKANECSAP